MDSQHRHELQQNDLRKITNRTLPFFEKYGLQVASGVAVAVALGIGAVWWYSQSTLSSSDGWTQLDQALHKQDASAADFAGVNDQHPGSTAAAWANLKAAEDHLKHGMKAAFSDRDASLADLKKAQASFQKLEGGGTRIAPEIRERALFGLARCLESLSDGNNDEAIKVYSRLNAEFPQGMFKGMAEDRIKTLASPEAKDFYAWFHQQKPQPKDPHPFPGVKSSDSSTDDPDGAEETMDVTDPPADSETEAPADSSDKTKSDDAPESSEKPSETPGSSESP